MNLLAANLVEQFYSLIWPLLRISAFLTFASIYSIRAVNLRVRITLALVLTIFLVLQLRLDLPKIDPLTVEGLREIFNQLFIGFTMALIMQLATASVVVAGQAVSNSMGLSIATMIDPTLGNVPLTSQFFTILGTLIFVSTGGDLIVFGILLDSFQYFPIGKTLFSQDLMGKMISWSSIVFVGSVLVSLPVMITLLFVNVGLGFVTRAAPSLNIFSVGFPAMMFTGFLVLWLAIPSILSRIDWLWIQTFNEMRAIMHP
jgi:flagellar biosynthetic protein FliR